MCESSAVKSEIINQCRICLVFDDEMFDMFDVMIGLPGNDLFQASANQLEAFNKLTGIPVSEGDGVTRFLCPGCFEKLRECILLRQQATEDTDEKPDINTVEQGTRVNSGGSDEPQVKMERSTNCRICGESDHEPSDLFVDIVELAQDVASSLREIFQETTGIYPLEDEKSRVVCNKCVARLKDSAVVLRQATESYGMLKQQDQGFTILKIEESADGNHVEDDMNWEDTKDGFGGEMSKKPNLHECDRCEKAFVSRSKLVAHKRVHTKYVCPICNRIYAHEANYRKHLIFHGKNITHDCHICPKSFTTSVSLRAHLNTHSNERPFRCTVCPKAFKKSDALKIHIRSHTNERPYGCDICSKTFYTRSNLKAHIRTHSTERPYSCELCDKSFYDNCTLKTHLRQHIEGPTHICDICSKAFMKPSTLKAHRLTHDADCRFVCNVCSKVFKSAEGFKYHTKIHTDERPFGCHMCSKSFSRSSNLKVHIRTHFKEEVSFTCQTCNKTFADVRGFKSHERSHEKVRNCAICFRTFSTIFCLKNHLRIHLDSGPYNCYLCEVTFPSVEAFVEHTCPHMNDNVIPNSSEESSSEENTQSSVGLENHSEIENPAEVEPTQQLVFEIKQEPEAILN